MRDSALGVRSTILAEAQALRVCSAICLSTCNIKPYNTHTSVCCRLSAPHLALLSFVHAMKIDKTRVVEKFFIDTSSAES